MPTYAYECGACGHTFEKFQSMTANSLRKCPSCGARKLQRLIGPGAGIIFKGSGFYETDYRSASYSADAKKDKERSESSSGESKSDKKPADQKAAGKKKKKKKKADD